MQRPAGSQLGSQSIGCQHVKEGSWERFWVRVNCTLAMLLPASAAGAVLRERGAVAVFALDQQMFHVLCLLSCKPLHA
jgi:hypothetical protein